MGGGSVERGVPAGNQINIRAMIQQEVDDLQLTSRGRHIEQALTGIIDEVRTVLNQLLDALDGLVFLFAR